MKRFIVKVILFFVIIALIDVAFGTCCDYLYEHSKGGDAYRINYAISQGKANILIMGSSRANHHYNPNILTDSLGIDVYNLGVDGSGVILMDGFYRLIVKRYIPDLIIYELTPSFDFLQYSGDANNTRYLSQLKPYYREECLSTLFDDVDPKARFKLHSGLYRYNTSFLNLIRFYHKRNHDNGNGYLPLQGVMTEYAVTQEKTTSEVDSIKIKYLRQFMADCRENGTQLVFIISPKYRAVSSEEFQPGIEVCREEGYEVWNYYCDPQFSSVKELFKDSYHLNCEGADTFTSFVAHRIKDLLYLKHASL